MIRSNACGLLNLSCDCHNKNSKLIENHMVIPSENAVNICLLLLSEHKCKAKSQNACVKKRHASYNII